MIKDYNICSRCVMDTTADEIYFDKNNYCNFCSEVIQALQKKITLK